MAYNLFTTEEETEQFIKDVALMRFKQKQYFRTRSPRHLKESKELETKVDKFLKENLLEIEEPKENQPKNFSLF